MACPTIGTVGEYATTARETAGEYAESARSTARRASERAREAADNARITARQRWQQASRSVDDWVHDYPLAAGCAASCVLRPGAGSG